MIVVDLRKQQALDANSKAIQQINFTANLYRAGNTRNCLRPFTRNCKTFVECNSVKCNKIIFINIK